jgi:Mn-containing catalase
MSHGEDARGPWNEGSGPWPEGEEWEYIERPVEQIRETNGQDEKEPVGHDRDEKATRRLEKQLSKQRSAEVRPPRSRELQWSIYTGNGQLVED